MDNGRHYRVNRWLQAYPGERQIPRAWVGQTDCQLYPPSIVSGRNQSLGFDVGALVVIMFVEAVAIAVEVGPQE
jgi:hypothetical protein